MSAGHRQRGPQEGHSTMEEGEEMRDEEDEERSSRFREREREERTDEDEVEQIKMVEQQKMVVGSSKEVGLCANGVFLLCVFFFLHLWMMSKFGTMNWGGEGAVCVEGRDEWL